MITGKVKNIYSKITFSILSISEDENKKEYSIEIYEQENFEANPNIFEEYDVSEDYMDEHDLKWRYFTLESLMKEHNLKENEIYTSLFKYDIIYTKNWTNCGYEYDMEHEIHETIFKSKQHIIFNPKTQKLERKFNKYPIAYQFNKKENFIQPIKEQYYNK